MKRLSIVVLAALAVAVLAVAAFAVAQEPEQTYDKNTEPATYQANNPNVDQRALGVQTAPRPKEPPQPESPLAADMDAMLKATISRIGRDAVVAEATPFADADLDTCMYADDQGNVTVLLTKDCVAEAKDKLGDAERKQLPADDSAADDAYGPDTGSEPEPDGDSERP